MRSPRPRLRRIPDRAIKVAVPSAVQREDYTCGAAALLAIGALYGVGPDDEAQVARDMRMTRVGSDPWQVMRAARGYGLRCREYRAMTDRQLRDCLDAGRPVMIMLQAWAKRRPRSYRDRWHDGHWVIAIGYTRRGVYFEDPWLDRGRGYLDYHELDQRWHDVEGPRDREVDRLGIAIWGKRRRMIDPMRYARAIE